MRLGPLSHAGGAAPNAETQSTQSVSPDATSRSASKRQGSCSGAPEPKSGSHGKASHPTASHEHARAIVRRCKRQCREPRCFIEVAHKAVEHFEFERAEPPADQTATPKRAPFKKLVSASSMTGGISVRATGRPFVRARKAARLAASVAPSPAATTSIWPSKPGDRASARGASHTIRRATAPPSGPARIANRRFVKSRPGFLQSVADKEQDIRAHPGFAWGGQHDASLSQAIEIPKYRRRVHVLDDPADALGEHDRRPCSLDVRAQSRDERLSASRQQTGRGGRRIIERRRSSVDPCCGLGVEAIPLHALRPRLLTERVGIDCCRASTDWVIRPSKCASRSDIPEDVLGISVSIP